MSFKIPSFSLKPALFAAGLGIAAVGGATFAAGSTTTGSTPAAAQERPHHDPAARMAQDLQLDESQKASVQAIFERNRPAQQKLRERGKAHWDAMKALKLGSPDYSSRAQALADEAGTLARDRVLARTQLDSELATVLTPAQLEKFQARKMRGPHGHGGGRWHHRHDKGDGAPAPEGPDAHS
jgi:Spy/CpxP family protein refolding chaperone